MKAILTYDAYHDDFGGTIEDELVFNRLEAKAAQIIHRATHGRLLNEEPVRECAQHCACELIEMMHADASLGSVAQGREIASVSNDGVSMTFASSGTSGGAQTAQARYLSVVRAWLDGECTERGVRLLYAGVDA